MDSARFDRLSRLLAPPASRRHTIVGLAAALGLVAPPVAAKRKKKNACNGGCGDCRVCQKQGKKKRCIPKPDGTACWFGRCLSGACICGPELGNCENEYSCTTPLRTTTNCSGCGDVCEPNIECLPRPEHDGAVYACSPRLRQLCSDTSVCFPEPPAGVVCQPVDNFKGGIAGCGFITTPNPPDRCCIVDGFGGARGDCDCCGSSVARDGVCIPGLCAPVYNTTCTSEDDCFHSCNLSCKPAPDQGNPNQRRCLP